MGVGKARLVTGIRLGMDTSETYIKMSHAAFPEPSTSPEPPMQSQGQGIYIGKNGDWWADWHGFFIPLYRQDQLQKIMRFDAITLAQLLAEYVISHKYDPAKLPQPSMEQLWLLFVMSEKYNKTWDGEKWKTAKSP